MYVSRNNARKRENEEHGSKEAFYVLAVNSV